LLSSGIDPGLCFLAVVVLAGSSRLSSGSREDRAKARFGPLANPSTRRVPSRAGASHVSELQRSLRNVAKLQFVEVTEEAALASTVSEMGGTAGDYHDDGESRALRVHADGTAETTFDPD
jgi:hypothetical protein